MAQSAIVRLEVAALLQEACALITSQRPLNEREREALATLVVMAQDFQRDADMLSRKALQGD